MDKDLTGFMNGLLKKAHDYANALDRKEEREKSDPVALYMKADKLFEKGKEIPVAIQLLEKSAVLDYLPAQKKIAYLYEHGIDRLGIKPNHVKALKWYIILVENGNEDFLPACAYFFYNGFGTTKNLEKFFYYSKLSANTGNNFGLRFTGLAYLYGEGVEKNIDEAIEYFQRASNQT